MKIFSPTLKGTTTVSGGTTDLSGSFIGTFSGSVAGIGGDVSAYSASVTLRTVNLEAASGSFSTRTTTLEGASASFSTRTTNIERVYATTGSNTFTGAQTVQGTLTAQTLVVQTVTSSVLFTTGSNKIGSSLANVQEVTGSVGITGSLAVNGTLSGTSATFSSTLSSTGNLTVGNAVAGTNVKLIFNGVASKAAGIEFQQSGTPQWYIGNGIASEDNNFELYNSNGTMAMKIIKSTNAINFQGAATFSSTVTATAPSSGVAFQVNGRSADNIGQILFYANNGTTLQNYIQSRPTYFAINTETNTPMYFGTYVGGTGGTRMTIDGSGNVGIGTTSPITYQNYRYLQINGASTTQGGVVRLGTSDNSYTNELAVDSSGGYINSSTHFLLYAGSGTPRMYVNGSSGNVGIGTTSPYTVLHIIKDGTSGYNASTYASSGIMLSRTGGSSENIALRTTNSTQVGISGTNFAGQLLSDGNNIFEIYTTSGSPLVLGTSATERMRIASNGNVGIGVSPLTKLHVLGGNVAALFNGNFSDAGGYSGILVSARDAQDSNGQYCVEIRATNTQGTPNYLNPKMEFLVQNNNSYLAADRTVKMTITGAGSIGAPNGTNIYNASDLRLKQNISTTTYGLDTVGLLNPVKFNWADGFESSEDGKDLLGFIAQEVSEVIPEAVESFGGDIDLNGTVVDNPLRVNEKFLIPVLVKAIQELSAKVAALEAR